MNTAINSQIPAQVKEIAEKTVDQAEKAMTAFMQAAKKSVDLVPAPATEVSKATLAMTEQNIQAVFDHARKLLQAETPQQFIQLQTEFLQMQFRTVQDQMSQLGTTMTAAVNKP